MATSFRGWLSSWGNSWGTAAVDPNAMQGSAAFSFSATATAVQPDPGTLFDILTFFRRRGRR